MLTKKTLERCAKRWEYRILELQHPYEQPELDRCGNEGFELVTITADAFGNWLFAFKREVIASDESALAEVEGELKLIG